MRVVGADPGKSGAVALIEDHKLIGVFDMPVLQLNKGTQLCPHSLNGLLSELLFGGPVDLAIVEKVHSMPKQGTSSSFDFGYSYGLIVMALVDRGIRLELVSPNKWKSDFGLNSDKCSSLAMAKAKWPDAEESFRLKRHDGRAEAALLAEWGRKNCK